MTMSLCTVFACSLIFNLKYKDLLLLGKVKCVMCIVQYVKCSEQSVMCKVQCIKCNV